MINERRAKMNNQCMKMKILRKLENTFNLFMFSRAFFHFSRSAFMIKLFFSFRRRYVLTSREYIRLALGKRNCRQMMNKGNAKKLLKEKELSFQRDFFP
jgi:hypothetical protein